MQLSQCTAGINGCSLKTVDNLAVMANIPAERLLLETDSPYCDVRPSHAGKQYVKTVQQAKDKKKYDEHMLVKGRNEPCNIVSVFEVVSGQDTNLVVFLLKHVLLRTAASHCVHCVLQLLIVSTWHSVL